MQEISYHSQGAAWLSDWLALLLHLCCRMIFTLRMEPSPLYLVFIIYSSHNVLVNKPFVEFNRYYGK